ncbi:hypothetical protein AMECASPLE_024932 [Ameca splendens]|uniref:Uncharacterized protein n=1 Tax=Ameca splendens TaxID=208324 RepID=A0ABV0Y4M8_9TELE
MLMFLSCIGTHIDEDLKLKSFEVFKKSRIQYNLEDLPMNANVEKCIALGAENNDKVLSGQGISHFTRKSRAERLGSHHRAFPLQHTLKIVTTLTFVDFEFVTNHTAVYAMWRRCQLL